MPPTPDAVVDDNAAEMVLEAASEVELVVVLALGVPTKLLLARPTPEDTGDDATVDIPVS